MPRFRDLDGLVGKRDAYSVDPRMLKVDPTYNVRDMKDAETIAHVRQLADSIKESGVKVPLEVRNEGNDIFVVAGHCRHAAVMLAIKEGAEIKSVLCLPEAAGTNEEERVLNLILTNSGKNLTPLAIAEVMRRLVAFGWTHEEIAKRTGYKTIASVDSHLMLLGASADVKNMIRNGEVSATTAIDVVRKDGAKAGETLRKAAAVAAASGKNKVTAKSLRKAKGDDFKATPADVRKLVAALQAIAGFDEDERSSDKARATLESLNIPVEWE